MRRMIKASWEVLLVTGTWLLLAVVTDVWCLVSVSPETGHVCIMCNVYLHITSSHMSEIPPATTDRTPGSQLTNQRPSWGQATNQRRAVLGPGLIS